MDLLLKSLQSKCLGPSVGGIYARGFIYTDVIRTISTPRATLQEQINAVRTFAANNGLTLNPTKCGIANTDLSIKTGHNRTYSYPGR